MNLDRMDSLNGYHENIMEALRTAKIRRDLSETTSTGGNIVNDETLRKPLTECGYLDTCHKDMDGQDDINNQNDKEMSEDGICSVLRIRNLEDLIKQLEHHSVRHTSCLSPCGSEEMRIPESEADRHYRIDSSVCSESSQG